MPFNANIAPEYRAAYLEHDRALTIRKTRLGCFLGMVMVPLFGGLDHWVYPILSSKFFLLRLLCSALMAGLYLVMGTRFGKKYYHFQGLVLLFLPSASIAWMVYATEGTASPYYAGLTLVLMVLAVVLDWPLWQSIVSVALVLFLYLTACLLSKGPVDIRLFINHLFFLTSSGIAIIAGAHYHSSARIREFVLTKQLVRSEKMAATGIVSAGIIHEINNPLNFSTTGLYTLRKKGKYLAPEQQSDYAEILTDVEDGLKRVQTIVSSLRTLTHPNSEQPKPAALNPVPLAGAITEAFRFLNKDTVAIRQELPENQIVWANHDQLVQVLENLLKNSLDALKTKTFTNGERPTIWLKGRMENGQSILSVRDNGSGIDPKHLDKIFDPFFTTKAVGAGMGLGLSNCYSIVQEYGGKIFVKSEPGKYCEFTLEFPDSGHQVNS